MPRKYKLSWQPGADGRKGRWRKKYKGKTYYFPGGGGKTDREAYDTALADWERLKVQIDAETPKPHQEVYERAISEWVTVQSWCRKHSEDGMADVAVTKLERLRKRLGAASKPKPLNAEDTFDGYLESRGRSLVKKLDIPNLDDMVEELVSSGEGGFGHLQGYEEYIYYGCGIF